MMDCNPLISDPFQFPKRLQNRAGLPRISYRIGHYDDFVEAMMRRINAAPELSSWTHRDSDDPGIALLEGAAILGDILSFYQEHYANEAFLRTAAWRESIAELVRPTGYRLAPGIGGRATLAFEARGNFSVIIPKSFSVKVELANDATPADFQTNAELVAWPHLGRFNLYRARSYGSKIPANESKFEIASIGNATDSSTLEAIELKKGDRLLLLPEETMLEPQLQLQFFEQFKRPAEEIVIVDQVERSLGRVVITVTGKLTRDWPELTRAYRLGRSFPHFGAMAPLQFVETNTATNPPVTTSVPTQFDRNLRISTTIGNAYSVIDPGVFALDQEVSDFSAGSTVIVSGIATGSSCTINPNVSTVPFSGFNFCFLYVLPFAVARHVNAIHNIGLRWGNLSSPITALQLDNVLAPSTTKELFAQADLRTLRLYETKGSELRLRPVSTPNKNENAFSTGINALYFYGTAAQVQAITGRRLYLSHVDGRSAEMICTNVAADFPAPTPNVPQMWPLSFDRAPIPFTRADFDESTPTVTVFGNLIDASQGKQEREAILGNGDNRQSFQTFQLPKAPLTYFLSASTIPPHVPELEIWVNDRLWTRVDTFYDRGSKEHIYIVREDAEGRSFVQFGDGENGARLPSGIKNVRAVYRSGVGARGVIKPSTTPTASERPPGFNKVMLAGIVSGGADPEDLEKAREAAPGKVQSLGRIVSLRDYETEMLAIPGVVTATATWDLYAGTPAVILRVLLEAGRETEFGKVHATIAHAQRCRGSDRFALIVKQAMLRYIFLDLTYARDPSYRQEDVEVAIQTALGLVGDKDHERSGLFGLRARRIGDAEYASRIEGRLQNVAGVLWCKASAFGLFAAPTTDSSSISDPSTLVLPSAPRPLTKRLDCNAHELLQLTESHLTLTAVAEVTIGECT